VFTKRYTPVLLYVNPATLSDHQRSNFEVEAYGPCGGDANWLSEAAGILEPL
jgi:hypothetical protein